MSASNTKGVYCYFDNRVQNNLLYQNTDCSGAANQTDIGNPSATIVDSSNQITTIDPLFVNGSTTPYNLQLQAGSPFLNAGSFLTTASGSGTNSTTLVVADATYFRSGFGIDGELGDVVQLRGQTATARVIAVDYTTNTLTLDSPLTWSSGTEVSLVYSGTAPEPGAYEIPQ